MKLNIQLFASGSKIFDADGYLQGKIEWSAIGNVATNKSPVVAKLYARRTNSATTTGKNWNGYITIDGKKSSFSSLSSSTSVSNSWVLMHTYTKEIEHNSDGTKTITIAGSITGPSGTSLSDNTSKGSFSVALDDLHKLPDNISYEMLEINEKLINAGIDNDVFVKDLSIKSFNISGNTYDNATIKNYGIVNRIALYGTATLPLVIDFSQNEILTDLTYVTKVPIAGRIIDSYDTAGFSETSLFDYIPYNKIELVETSTTVKRNGQTSGKVKLNVNGSLYNGVVGSVDQTLYTPIIKYKFWKTGTEEPTTYDYEIPSENITIENGVFSVSNYEIGSSVETDINWFNPDNAYKVKIYVEDNFTSYVSQEKSIALGEATWTEYKDRVDFKKLTIKGDNVVAPRVGDIIITSTNTNPEIDYGGTWELIDKEFTPTYIYSSDTTYLSRSNISGANIRIRRSGHSISVGINMVTNAQVNDTAVSLGTLKLSAMGMKSKSGNDWVSAWTDGGNCMVMLEVQENFSGNCNLTVVDVVPESSVASGQTVGFSHTFVAESFGSMDDAACNKFYWKRIS